MKRLLVPLSVLAVLLAVLLLSQPSRAFPEQPAVSLFPAESNPTQHALQEGSLLGQPNPPWYDPAWTIRRHVTITNTGSILTNYQVLVNLGSSFDFSNVQADGADLRVTAADGITLLSFWIESWNSTSQRAWVWVKIPSLPVGNTVIYLYYGNPSATPVSNGKNTFEVYDGFETYALGSTPTGDYGNPGEWARYPGNPVLNLGSSGAWDATGTTFASVISDTTAGQYRMYYHGWGATSPCTGSCIGLATSADGRTWTKYGSNPVMTPGPAAWDAGGVRVPMVWKEGPADYRMIYTGSGSGGLQVGYATSADGISWTKYAGNPVFNDPTWANGSTENWGVIRVGPTYLMWYSDLSAPRESGIATSTDLIHWTPYSAAPIFATSGVPSDYRYSQFCPYTFAYGGYYYVIVPSYTSVGDYSHYYLYRSSSPYFPTSDRHLVRVIHTPGASGQWDAVDTDTPFLLTTDVLRNSFPRNQLWTYYAGAGAPGNTWREGLLIETDIAAALTDAALPGGTLAWSATGDVTVVGSPVRQGLRSLRLNDTSSSASTNIMGSFASIERGSLGAWMRRNSTPPGDYDIYLYDGATLAAVAGLGRNGYFHYWNKDQNNPPGGYPTGFHDTGAIWSIDTWYLVTMDFNAATDRYDFVVYDQNLTELVRQTGIAFGNAATAINAATIYTDNRFVGMGFADDYRLRKNESPAPTVQVGAAQQAVDLAITKTASAGTVYLGDTLVYTLHITNTSLHTAPSVIVTDTLPAAVSLVSAVPSHGSCGTTRPVVCTLGNVAGGGHESITITVTATSVGLANNTASVDSAAVDVHWMDNTASVATVILANADLSVSQVDAPDPVWVGNPVTYTITVHNGGPSLAQNVTLTDTFPSEMVLTGATPGQGSCTLGRPLTCSLGSLTNGQNVVVNVFLNTTLAGLYTNTVRVASSSHDPNLLNNTSLESTVVATQADLGVSQTVQPATVYAGDPLTYTITVHNAGPNIAVNVRLTDTLPGGTTFISATPSPGGSCSPGAVITCTLGNLPAGGNATVIVVVNTTIDGLITNTVRVSSDTSDQHPANNLSQVAKQVYPAADLGVSQEDTPDPVRAGHAVTYTLTVHNGGPSSSASVTLTDNLPAGVGFVSAEPAAYCSQASPVVCTLPGLLAGGDSQVQVVVMTTQEGLLTNTVTVASSTHDRNLANNTSLETTVVAIAADLSITQMDTPDPVLAEGQLTYQLTVHNAGPSIAAAVRLTDTLPGGVILQSVTPESGSCSGVSVIVCTLGNLASGADVHVVVVVVPQVAGSITNTVVVSTLTYEGNLANNTSQVNTTVLPLSADLALSLNGAPNPVAAGALLTYTAHVTNLGPSRAINPSVSVELSNKVSFVSSTPACSLHAGALTCPLNEISSGGSADVVITVRVSSSTFVSQISSQADVTSSVADPAPGNNHAVAITNLYREADLSIALNAEPNPVAPKTNLTYTLVYTNHGPSNAINLIVTDTLPADVDYVAGLSSPECAAVPATYYVICSPHDLAAGMSAQIVLVVKVKEVATPPLVNQVEITSATPDPDLSNNQAEVTTSLDMEPPSLQWLAPERDDSTSYYVPIMYPGLEITLTVMVTDNVQVDLVLFKRWDHVRNFYVDIGPGVEVSPGVWQYVWVFSSYLELVPGQNAVYVYVYDTAGNYTRARIWVWPYPYPLVLPSVMKK